VFLLIVTKDVILFSLLLVVYVLDLYLVYNYLNTSLLSVHSDNL